MPKVDRYLAGFGLQKNSYLDGYYLKDFNIDHVSVKKYREYNYPSKLVWELHDPSDNPQNFEQDLRQYLSAKPTIYTRYGNPYECDFGHLNFTHSGSQIIVTSQGTCVRV